MGSFLSVGGLDRDWSPCSGPGLLSEGDARGRAASPFRQAWAGGGQGSRHCPHTRGQGAVFSSCSELQGKALPVGQLPWVSCLSLPLSRVFSDWRHPLHDL